MAKRLSPNMTITVPAELRAQMDAVPGRINWSAVATEAFKAKLTEIASRKVGDSMDDVIARMRATAALEANQDYADGRAAGEWWARNHATPKQLRRLAGLANDSATEDLDYRLDLATNGSNTGAGQMLYDVLHPGADFDSTEVQDFWGLALGDDDIERIEEKAFAKGFVEGALDIWNRVADKI